MFLRYHRRGLLYSNLEKSARKDFNDDQKTLIQYFRMVQDRILDGETTLEKDASVTDWQLNDMISFQKKLYLFHYHLSYKVSNSFLAVKMSVQIVFSKSKIFGDIDVVDKSRW